MRSETKNPVLTLFRIDRIVSDWAKINIKDDEKNEREDGGKRPNNVLIKAFFWTPFRQWEISGDYNIIPHKIILLVTRLLKIVVFYV